jgi:hypothetical protein
MVQGSGSGAGIGELDRELSRLRRRAARQRQSIETSSQAWQQWSSTMDEIASIIEQLVASPAPNVESIATKFHAILWLIEVNESLLDTGDIRRLRRFGRDLRHLAGLERR